MLGSGLMADRGSASGLAVVVFMAPACCREPGPAIGKSPGSTLMIRRPDQGLPGWPPAPIWRDDGGMEERTGWLGYRYRRRGPLGWVRGPRGSGPLRRGKDDRLAGGVAAGLASRMGFDVNVVRLVFIAAPLGTRGSFAVGYVLPLLLVPADGADGNIASQAVTDRRGIAVAPGLAAPLVGGGGTAHRPRARGPPQPARPPWA